MFDDMNSESQKVLYVMERWEAGEQSQESSGAGNHSC